MICILIVDDEMINRLLLKLLLEAKYKIAEAENGQEAIEMAKSKEYDIILMDINMPVLNGIDATKYIRKHISKDIPIVAVTANEIRDFADEYIAAGFTELIQKPIDKDNVIETIERLTKNKDERNN